MGLKKEDFDLALKYWEMREVDIIKAFEFYKAHKEAIDRACSFVVGEIIKERKRG